MTVHPAAVVRAYDPARDASDLRACFVELQDSERAIDARAPRGEDVADAYLARMLARCQSWTGRVFVAERGERVVGFVCVWGRVPPQEPDEPPEPYAYVSDLVVLPPCRRRGIGRALLAEAECYARGLGASSLGIGVMAGNEEPLRLYESLGYRPIHVELRKPLG